MKRFLAIIFAATALQATTNTTTAQTHLLFQFPDTIVTWIVPPLVDSLALTLYGGNGGNFNSSITGYSYGTPGKGAIIQATLPVMPGDTLYLYIGGGGYYGSAGGTGGFNGGGAGGEDLGGYTGGGGGATDIRIGGRALANRILVAGGGGGSSYDAQNSANTRMGGNGGYLYGQAGFSNGISGNPGGGGGTATYGGAGGSGAGYTAQAGALGQGGSSTYGGGGGGGYYGGGAGTSAGGGGGSSYADLTKVHDVQYLSVGGGGIISIRYTPRPTGVQHVDEASNKAYVVSDAAGGSRLSLLQSSTGNVDVSIVDMTGQVAWRKQVFLQKGRSVLDLPDDALAPGMYLIQVKSNDREKAGVIKWLNR